MGIPCRVYHVLPQRFDPAFDDFVRNVESVTLVEANHGWEHYRIVDGAEICYLTRELPTPSHERMPSDCVKVVVLSHQKSGYERIFARFDEAFAKHHDSDWVRRLKAQRR